MLEITVCLKTHSRRWNSACKPRIRICETSPNQKTQRNVDNSVGLALERRLSTKFWGSFHFGTDGLPHTASTCGLHAFLFSSHILILHAITAFDKLTNSQVHSLTRWKRLETLLYILV